MAMESLAEPSDIAVDAARQSAGGRARDATAQTTLSTLPAGRFEQRLALAVVLLSATVFAIAIPYAKTPLVQIPAFIPIYETALIVNEAITALLLIGLFIQVRARALLLLACGYLFEAIVITAHALTFPGLFTETGLLGANPQSTAWLYMFWHGGFPLFVIGYVWLSHLEASRPSDKASATDVVLAFGVTIALAVGCILLATAAGFLLPGIMDGNGYTAAMKFVVGSVWLSSAAAVLVLWRKANRSALDVWLMVVMAAWICDVGLSAVFNAARFDFGFYAGRVYGYLAASFVLAVLLLETSGLYSRMARTTSRLQHRTRRLEQDVQDRISEQEKTEAQLRQAQKMEAIGNLTGGMAHDFNNLLAIIIGNLDALCERRPDDQDIQKFAVVATEAAVRGADLTRRLLAFARRQPLKPQQIDVNELVSGITKLLERTLGQNIEVKLELAPAVWPSIADPAQLESALANLATNARDAMPNGGRLSIVTRNDHLDEDYVAQHPGLKSGDYIAIEVRDSGTGMPPDVLGRVFEPFFTTKDEGKGTGLGLAMVYGFMKQSNGHINVYSEVGIGTVFRLYLPRLKQTVDSEREESVNEIAAGFGEVVLAVEDNAGLREIVVHQLRQLGYQPLEAGNAAEAMAVLTQSKVDLLFTDIVMPGGISGFDLAREAQDRWPALKVVFTSGFPDLKMGSEAEESLRRNHFLGKPYRRDDLRRTLRQALDG